MFISPPIMIPAAARGSHSPPASMAPPANMGALTSLRALLAWWVVVFHLAPLAPFHLHQSAPILHKGPVLVDCFFVLSGLVLFHVHPHILSGPDRWRAVAHFLAARIARLYPTHLAVLFGFVFLLGALHLATGFRPAQPDDFTATRLVEQLLLLHGIFLPAHGAWNFPSWSVSTECAAYLLAPLLFREIARASRPALLIAGGVVSVLVATGVESGWLTRSPEWLAVRVVLEFLLGALLRVFAGAAFPALLRVRMPALLLGWAAVLAFAPSGHPGLFLAAMVWLMLFLSLGEGWHGRLGAVCRYLGETSYAVYMCHALVLTVWAGLESRFDLGLFGAPVPAFLLLCCLIQAGACLLHHLVEIPGRRAVRGWAGRWLDPSAAAAAIGTHPAAVTLDTCASVSPRISTT